MAEFNAPGADAVRPLKRRAADLAGGADLLTGEIPVRLLDKINKLQEGTKKYTTLQYKTVKMLFNTSQEVQYLNGLLLLGLTGIKNARDNIAEYRAKIETRDSAAECEWYQAFIQDQNLFVNMFFNDDAPDDTTAYMRKFILNVARRRAVDLMLTQASVASDEVNLNYDKFPQDVKKAMKQMGLLGIGEQGPKIVSHSSLQTLINDVAMDIVFRVRNECAQYPRGEALKTVVENLRSDREFDAEEYNSSEVYYTLADIYGYDARGESLADYDTDEDMAGELRPTLTSMSGLQLRLRLT